MPHIHDKIDFTVETLIVHKDKVLLRMHDKYKLWLGVGGHIELDEDPNQAAIREAKEEVGLDIELVPTHQFSKNIPEYKELIAPVFLNRHKINETHEHVTLWFFARSNSDRVAPNEPETKEYKWFTRAELDDPRYQIRDSIIFYAKAALDQLSS